MIDPAQFKMGPAPTVAASDDPPELLQATYPPDILPGLVAKAHGHGYRAADNAVYPPPPPPPDDAASGDVDTPGVPPLTRESGWLQAPVYPVDILPMLVAKSVDRADTPIEDPARYPPPPPPPSDTASSDDPIETPPDTPPPDTPMSPPVNVDLPAVLQDGPRLTCTMGNWTGEPFAYDYQWLLDGTVTGTSVDTLVVTADDIGKTAICNVLATNDSGAAEAESVGLVIAAFT
jgi:hypothetical protein